MRLYGSLTRLFQVIFSGTGGDTTLQPAASVAADVTITLPAETGTLRNSAVPIEAADIDSFDASKVTAGVLAKARGGCGDDMTDVTFPSAGVIPTRSSGTFTAEWRQSGGTYSVDVTASYTKIGREVTLTIPAFLGATNVSNAITCATLPAALYPQDSTAFLAAVRSASTYGTGFVHIIAAGTMTIYYTLAGGAFPSGQSNSGSPYTVSFTYVSAA